MTDKDDLIITEKIIGQEWCELPRTARRAGGTAEQPTYEVDLIEQLERATTNYLTVDAQCNTGTITLVLCNVIHWVTNEGFGVRYVPVQPSELNKPCFTKRRPVPPPLPESLG